jgi:hypothetical protein
MNSCQNWMIGWNKVKEEADFLLLLFSLPSIFVSCKKVRVEGPISPFSESNTS